MKKFITGRSSSSLFVLIIILGSSMIFGMTTRNQEDSQLSFQGKFTQEKRENFTRFPDSTRLDDHRLNAFLKADYQKSLISDRRIGYSMEVRHHSYSDYHRYNRTDFLGNIRYQQPFYSGTRLYLNSELRTRISASSDFAYYRYIGDAYLSIPSELFSHAYLGYQLWLKYYPGTSDYRDYFSNRFFTKMSYRFSSASTLGLNFEFQHHEGNPYPGSTPPNQEWDFAGDRYVVQVKLDQIFNTRLITNFLYRFEHDVHSEADNEVTGETWGDENDDELLAEDSDFAYLKHQFAATTLLKLNKRISLLAFYLYHTKDFEYWRIEDGGDRRSDQLLFLSHNLKIKLNPKWTVEIQHNFEKNQTNLNTYKYEMTSVSAGISFKF